MVDSDVGKRQSDGDEASEKDNDSGSFYSRRGELIEVVSKAYRNARVVHGRLSWSRQLLRNLD
jgi:hypothetical protein